MNFLQSDCTFRKCRNCRYCGGGDHVTFYCKLALSHLEQRGAGFMLITGRRSVKETSGGQQNDRDMRYIWVLYKNIINNYHTKSYDRSPFFQAMPLSSYFHGEDKRCFGLDFEMGSVRNSDNGSLKNVKYYRVYVIT